MALVVQPGDLIKPGAKASFLGLIIGVDAIRIYVLWMQPERDPWIQRLKNLSLSEIHVVQRCCTGQDGDT